jgi:hypothetical protein
MIKRVQREAHRVPGPPLLGLVDKSKFKASGSSRLYRGTNPFGLVTDDDDDSVHVQGGKCVENMEHHGSPA